MSEIPQIFECHRCFAWSNNAEPPHGWGNPCPQVLKTDDAYIAKLDAERMFAIRQGGNFDVIADAQARMADEITGDA